MPTGSKLSLSKAVEILSGIHLLKVLVLHRALQSPIPSNHLLQISLPNLITLIIEAPMIHTVLLLESISTPHLQTLEVYLEGVLPVGSTMDQMQFFSAVGAKARLTAYHTLFVALEEKFANVVGFLGTIAHDSAPLHSNTFHLMELPYWNYAILSPFHVYSAYIFSLVQIIMVTYPLLPGPSF